MRNNILQRPMFRRNGSPSTGERVSNLQTLLQDIRDTERLRSTVGDAESDNVQRQLGNLLKVPFEEFQGKYVRNPKTGEFEPMSGPLTGTVVRESEMMMSPDVETIFVIDRREGSETFGMEIPVPRNMETYEMIRSGMFEFDEIAGMAEGGEMKSDAVGIADGLDQETPKADPNTTGVAKVSPEQYVELMNQVRGDEVPLEGRVQELAMTVGEKDAQDTPLSVLALVQPVFELQEQQGGLAAAPGAQQMMQQQNPMMMAKDGGIVQRFNGSDSLGERSQNVFSALGESGVYDPAKLKIAEALAKVYNVTAEPFDTQASRQKYEQMLIDKEGLRDEALLAAAPEFLRIGALALDPNATLTDVFREGATGLARFGTTQGKKLKNLEQTALKMALADKATQDKSKQAYISAITGPLLEDAFKTSKESQLEDLNLEELTVKIAGDKIKNTLGELDLTAKNLELSYMDENLKTDLDTKKAELQTTLTLLENLPEKQRLENEGLINQNKLAIAQIEGADLANQLTQFDISKRPITDALEIEAQRIKNLSDQLDYNAKPDMIKEQLEEMRLKNQKAFKEIEVFDDVQAQQYLKNEMEIKKLLNEINNPKKDFAQIKEEGDLRKEYKKDVFYSDAQKKYKFYTDISNAILNRNLDNLSEDSKVFANLQRDGTGATDLVIMFNFMKMLDPESVVREGEQIILKKTNPLTKRYSTLIDNLNTGGFLGDEQKQMLLNETRVLMSNAYNNYVEMYNDYANISNDAFGADRLDLVVPKLNFELFEKDQELADVFANIDSD